MQYKNGYKITEKIKMEINYRLDNFKNIWIKIIKIKIIT